MAVPRDIRDRVLGITIIPIRREVDMKYLFDWAGRNRNDGSDKFWRIIVYEQVYGTEDRPVSGGFIATRYWGRWGKNPKNMMEQFTDEWSAVNYARKFSEEKQSGGYTPCKSSDIKIIEPVTLPRGTGGPKVLPLKPKAPSGTPTRRTFNFEGE